MTVDEQLDELLYNKRYSLLFEGGHRWIDMRRYDKLGDITLDVSTNVPPPVFTMPTEFPVPTQECVARVLASACGITRCSEGTQWCETREERPP